MPPFTTAETDRRDRLAEFAESFHDLFPRSDQARWLSVYLQGLIEASGRRTVEAIARAVPVSRDWGVAAPAQALQHFLSNSRWDERELLRRFRTRHGDRLNDSEAVWVLHELIVPKRGRHSVGVHRQFSRSEGKKVNCQTAVLLSQSGPHGWLPLGCRLYLPRTWLSEASPQTLAGIPEPHRAPIGKGEVAVALIDEVRGGTQPPPIVADGSLATSDTFREQLRLREMVCRAPAEAGAWWDQAREGGEWLKSRLGFDDFEGRSWTGWHHHAGLVCLAFGFLRLHDEAEGRSDALEP